MRVLLAITCLLLLARGHAQTTVFSENMGTGASGNAIGTYTGFQNYGTLVFTGTGDVRSTTASSGYAGASGNNNVFLTYSKNFQIEGINTSSCSSFTLSFGVYKSTTASNGSELLVEVSTDGVTYSALTMPTLPTGAGTATWYLVTITSGIPATANLRIRFTNTAASGPQFRIDDVILTANCSANTITTGAVTSGNFTWTCGGSCTGTVAFTSTGSYNSGNVYSVQLSDASGSFASPITIGTLTSTANSGTISITIPWNSSTGTGYQVQVVSSNPAITGSASSTFTITAPTCCPYMTGAVLNSCNNPGCNEGDSEIMLFNSGSYPITTSSFPTHAVDYYGNTANYNSNTVNAYTGTASADATTTSALNGLSGCSGAFVDASSAGTIPAYSTFIMVPLGFCYVNYDFSALCSNNNPIYVVYFGTAGWNTSGNLANYQSGVNPKYLVADFSWVNGACSKEYYTYDAGLEYSGGAGSGDGASVSYSQPVSTASASPVSPDTYTGAGSCALPLVLPVNLVEFKAERYTTSLARVSFITNHEDGVKKFVLYKSYDAFNYLKFSEQEPHNAVDAVHYAVYDNVDELTSNLVYYRLEEEDLNGEKKNLATAVLGLEQAGGIKITNNGLVVSISSSDPIKRVELYSGEGQLVRSMQGEESQVHYDVPLEGLPRGFYIISVTEASGRVTARKIIR